jgi:eukaryotic-like serine/threonine-protein kinase
VLELCDRGTLRHRADTARAAGWQPTDGDAIRLAAALIAAIGTLDRAGVVHRDLTPSNVLLTTTHPDPSRPDRRKPGGSG